MKRYPTITLSGVKVPEFVEDIEDAFELVITLKEQYSGSIYIADHTLIYKGKIGTVAIPLSYFESEEES